MTVNALKRPRWVPSSINQLLVLKPKVFLLGHLGIMCILWNLDLHSTEQAQLVGFNYFCLGQFGWADDLCALDDITVSSARFHEVSPQSFNEVFAYTWSGS